MWKQIIALAALVIVITGGAAQAAEVFGFDRAQDTGVAGPEIIYLVDPDTGVNQVVCRFEPAIAGNNNANSPNGLAYDQDHNRLYFAVFNTGTDPAFPAASAGAALYFCEPDVNVPDTTATFAGNLSGQPAGAVWVSGAPEKYVYIKNQTDDANAVTFNLDGTVLSEAVFAADLSGGTHWMRFGDQAQACGSNVIFGSTIGSSRLYAGGAATAAFFSYEAGDLLWDTINVGVGAPGTGLQLAFTPDGRLIGHSTATGQFYEVDPTDGSLTTLFDSALELTDLAETCDPLPEGSTTYTQGFFGSSKNGEALVAPMLAASPATCAEIRAIFVALGLGNPGDCAAVALFVTGKVGPGKDDGFLPSGFSPGQNLAAQKITALLNLLLPDAIGEGYYLNIDPLMDFGGVGWLDPILTTKGELGSCLDVAAPLGKCDDGSVVLTSLGTLLTQLDVAGTTVGDVLAEADDYILNGGDIVINGVTLSKGELTNLLGLINESYDEGDPTGVVTPFDVD